MNNRLIVQGLGIEQRNAEISQREVFISLTLGRKLSGQSCATQSDPERLIRRHMASIESYLYCDTGVQVGNVLGIRSIPCLELDI